MAILESGETNILEAEEINWRLIVYPLVGVIAVVLLGLAYYYYVQNEHAEREAAAQVQLLQAKTPEDFVKVADNFPGSTHATLALLSAAEASYDAKDFDGAIKDYQRVLDTPKVEVELHDSAQLGLAASLEQTGKVDDAIKAYLEVAHRGSASGFAPFAYITVARIYQDKGDRDDQRRALTEAANLNVDSPFVKEAAAQLKAMPPEASLLAPTPVSSAPPTP